MIHLGDISKINGAKIEPVDVITFGSPCQDLSVAGKRRGLEGERSGLFMDAVRIIKEMREATDGLYPNYAIWENVPGAFSSNSGRDFSAVLEELCRLCDPRARIAMPAKKWRKADYFCDGGWSIAYRVFDAQFWGVPQRRRRIALVVDFRGNTAPEILFERQGLRGDITPSGKARKEVAGDVEGSVREAVLFTPCNFGEAGQGYRENKITNTLDAVQGSKQTQLVVAYGICSDASNSMKSDNPHSGIYIADTSRTLDCNGGNPACNQGGIAVVHPAIVGTLAASGAGTERPAGQGNETDFCVVTLDCRNMAVNPELSATIQAKNNGGQSLNYINPVVTPAFFQNTGQGWWNQSEVAQCLRTPCGGDSVKANLVAYQQTAGELKNSLVFSQQRSDEHIKNDVVSTQSARQYKDATDLIVNVWRWIVRRFTPLECERLQGYPDYWTDVPPTTELSEQDTAFWREVFNTWDDINGVKHHSDKQIKKWLAEQPVDGARYKALGNSIALPPWKWVLKRVSAQFERDATLGSLFDGIGGFPLIWEQINGAGSARWASEIEPFPIRVTWTRFSRR